MYKLQEKSINRSNVLQGIVYVAILAILWLVWVNSMETYELKNNDNNKEELSLFWVIWEANAWRWWTAPKRSQKWWPNRTMPSPWWWWLVLENPSMTPQSLIDEITEMLGSACDWPAWKAWWLNWTTKEYWLQDKASFTEWQWVCDWSKKSFTCTEGAFMDGVNVAYLTTYKYSECIVWEPAKCIADTNYENNGHSYSTIEIEHWANGTFTSWEVSENDGKYTYDITLDCNDGTLENPSEASHVLISCDENFDESTTTAWLCEAWTKQWTCWWTIPDNAAATTETTFDQTWDPTANEWDPLTWVWWEAHEYCDFDCDESFVWDGSLCKSNAQECPIENGVWSQLWDDTLNNYGNCSLVECNADFHTEDDTTCVSNTKQESCIDSAPTSGTSTISQVDVTWNGTTWSEPEVCLWSCNADYHTEDNLTCVSDLKQEACTDSAPLNGTSTAVQVDVTWNGTTWTEPEVCLWTCNTDYHTDDNLTCISDSDQLACIDSAPTNGTSTIVQVPVTWDGSAWSTPETCDWSCDTDFHTEDDTTCISNTKQEACTNVAPTNATDTAEQVDVTWNGTTWLSPSNCDWTCNTDFHTEDDVTCVSDTQSCTVTNWTWTKVYNGSSWWICNFSSCNSDSMELNGECIKFTNPSYFTFDSTTGTITDYDKVNWPSDIVIPNSINWVDVTIIWNSAFSNNSITSVVFPNTILDIWRSAFSSNKLTEVIIPDSVLTIASRAFSWHMDYWENQLNKIIIWNNVTSIWDYAFSLTKVNNIVIWNSVTSIWK